MARTTLDTGSNGIQLQLEYGTIVDEETGGAVTAETNYVIISNAEAWIDANGYHFFDSSNTLTYSGGWVTDGSTSNIDMDTSGSIKIKELPRQHRVPTYGVTASYNIELEIVGINAAGTMSGAKAFTQPRLPYHAPAVPPVTITAAGVVTIPANQTNTTLDRYVETSDWRWETNGVFADFAMNQANTVLTKTQSATANCRHRMAVRLKNADATGNYGYSGYLYGTPAGPTGLTAARQTLKTTVNLSWASTAAYVAAYLVERSLDGGAYSQIGTTTSLTYSDPNVPVGSTANYRVRVQTPTGVNTAYSAFSAVASVQPGYSAPAAPTLVQLFRNDDSSAHFTVSGNQPSSDSDVYWQFIDWQLQTDTGAYAGGATGLSGATTDVTVSGLAANHRYRVQVRSRNVSGSSAWTQSGYIYTTPAAPTALTATRQGVTSTVLLNWAVNALWRDLSLVESSPDQVDWTQIGTSTDSTFTATQSTAAVLYYRVRAQTPPPVLQSGYSNSALVGSAVTSDKDGIPGVGRIYVGAERVRRVAVGSVYVWTDGDP